MAEISFKTLSYSGVTFTPNEYSIGDSIEWMNSHIKNIQREINLVGESPNQGKINSAKNTIDYAIALNDLPRLSFTLTIGDDFNLRAVSQSGYETNIAFKGYYENIASATEELKAEFKIMANAKPSRTPMDFGLKFCANCGSFTPICVKKKGDPTYAPNDILMTKLQE